MARRIGIIGFASNSGLGALSWEFCNHLRPARVLLVQTKYQEFPDRFPGARRGLTAENIDWLLSGIDVLLTFETPGGEWAVYQQARKRGVKTVLMPMYECMPSPIPVLPDLMLCPSKLDLKIFRSELRGKCEVEYLPVPVNRKRVTFQQRRIANVFEHHAGHGGLLGRNGTYELLAAAPMLKTGAKILIYSQRKLDFEHPNVEIRVGNFENYWDIWGHGDVFVFPHKFDGLSLPIQEALSSGMPVLSSPIEPFMGWLPNEWMIDGGERTQMRVFQRTVDIAVMDPAQIAAAIDAWYGKDIREASSQANRLAEALDWVRLKERYVSIFNAL